jgi:hypothetical protein
VDLYEALGSKVEEYVRCHCYMDSVKEFQNFFGVKGHYLGKTSGHGRGLTKLANVFMVIIYISVTGAPIFEGSFSRRAISINVSFLISSGFFLICILGAYLLYSRERRRVINKVNHDWAEFIEKFPCPVIPRQKDDTAPLGP